MTYARIVGGVVAELIEIEADGPTIMERFHPDLVAAMVLVPVGVPVAEKWTWDGGAFAAPVALPPPVPASISRRQMLLALVAGEVITPTEALAAATTGAVPAAIDAVFAQLPERDALAARIMWATTDVVKRAHPLIAAMIAAELVTAEQADALFVMAAAL